MKNANKHLNKGVTALTTLLLSVAAHAHGQSSRGTRWQRGNQPGRDFPNLHPRIVHFAIVQIQVGAVLQGLNLFFLTDKRRAVGLVAAVLQGAGYSVSRAGHFGPQLVHIEGVGSQGQHL